MPDQTDRQTRILSVNAWAGQMYPELSSEAAALIFDIAINDTLPDVTEAEIANTLAEMRGYREAMKRQEADRAARR